MKKLVHADWTSAFFGLTVKAMKSGSLVIADEHTVYVYDGHTMSEAISGINLIKDLLIDRWERLWVATYQGLYCLFNRNFTNHRLTDKEDIARAIGIDRNGSLVIGTLNGKVLIDGQIIEDDKQQYYNPSSTTLNGKVYMVGNGDIREINENKTLRWLGLPKSRYQFVTTYNDRLIVGSRKGIISYDVVTNNIDTLSTDILHPWCAARDAESRLWVGSSPGLYSLSKEGIATKTDYAQKLIVTTMADDGRGNIFFASADSLFVIRNGQVMPISSQIPELAGHEIRTLHVSSRGFLAIAVIDGLFLSRLDEECRLSDVRFFDHQNGFTALEPQMATMAETSDGTIWMAGLEEMTSFRPENLYTYSEEDTYIAPPLKWWQRWWIWMIAFVVVSIGLWIAARWFEHRRNRKEMMRLQREKLQHEKQINNIRQKAIESEPNELARDIVKMTENTNAVKMALHTINGTVIVEPTDIAYFKADGNYTQMVTFHGTEMIVKGIGTLMDKTLDQKTFVRADRSTVVNIHNITQLLPRERRCIFRSSDGQELETTLLAPAFKRLETLL